VSAGFVLLISKLVSHSGYGREITFGLAGILGLVVLLAGEMAGSRLLVGVGLLMAGWVVLPVIAIPLIFLWRFLTWCSQRLCRLTGRSV